MPLGADRSRRRPLRPGRWISIVLIAASIVPSLGGGAGAASQPTLAACRRPDTPAAFRRQLRLAIRLSGNLSREWADSPYIPKIICWQGTGFSTRFHAYGPRQKWIGVFAMTKREVQTIAGPWLSNDRHELILDTDCFAHGWDACRHRTENTRIVQQLVAGMRWIWLNYGRPRVAWRHIVKTGRLDSYPRTGTDQTPTHDPLRLCPVKRPVSYTDDFGEPRPVGGFHPHWGNDIVAPTGRPIRAPFPGLAVAHSDDWFAGHYVTVIGREGYVRNGHMSRFGKLGYVKAGTVIGYVGETGDARDPHDHFDWHPWNVPKRLHRAPTGYTRIMDGVDPFPFLNEVCR
jgi:murein DD-endopeptidase MepM/ murein hydrolase activator NlpD